MPGTYYAFNNNVVIHGERTAEVSSAGRGRIKTAVIISALSSLPLKKEEKDTCYEREGNMEVAPFRSSKAASIVASQVAQVVRNQPANAGDVRCGLDP